MNETYVIHVTKICNLNCFYCYETDKTSTYTWTEVKESLDRILENRTSDSFHIEFLGGEPMLGFENIKNTVEYLNTKELDVLYTITTNGTIINEELIDLLKENENLNFAISIDGGKFSNQHRIFKDTSRNSYDTIIKNFKKLQWLKIPDTQLGCHLTTTPFSIGYLKQDIKHLYKIGFRSFGIGTIESTIKIGKEYCDRYVKELKEISDLVKDGFFTDGIHVDVLESLKPRSDTRTYVRDSTGKVIFETYGRSGEDITHKNIDGFNATFASSEVSGLIEDIREIVFNYHRS